MLERILFERDLGGSAPADSLCEATVVNLLHCFQSNKETRTKLLANLTSSMHASSTKSSKNLSSSHRRDLATGMDPNPLLAAQAEAVVSEQRARELQREVETIKNQLKSSEVRAEV
jgi:hypothetical protein